MSSDEKEFIPESQEILEEIEKDIKKEFDNANGSLILDEETPHYVVGDLVIENMNIKFYHGKFYIEKNGVYLPGEKDLEKKLINICKGFTKSKRKEIMNYISLKTEIGQQELNPNLINFKNGLFNLTSKELLPHNPYVFTVNQIHANYNENIEKNEYIEKFLDDITCNNSGRKQAILELIGYCFTLGVWIGKAVVLYGPSAENGKSVFIQLLIHLIGRENVSCVPLHKLQERFYPANIADKLLNTTSELPKTDLKSVDVFKNVVTGDEIIGEIKFKDPFTFNPYAKHIFATNALPRNADDNDGYYRRLNILLFERKFTIEEQNNFIKENLFTQKALDYLAFISLQAYLKMLEEGRRNFANYEESNRLIDSYKADNNSVLLFLESDIAKDCFKNNERIRKTKLFEKYKIWCTDNNYISYRSKDFYKRIEETKTLIIKYYDGYECYQKREILQTQNPS